ncbi:hypothetical protein [Micromonospora echinofusca]|uniref:hypothetical protein n=1 Tax=Micromonospora echinofusca TaxID=47858 RepID=UPI0012FD28C8|nr:hypothetical protein [Micromonospora echinofusca]
MENNFAGRDINTAGRDNVITNYLTGLRRLRPRPVDPNIVMPPDRFAPPAGFDAALQSVRSTSFLPARSRVIVLRAPESSGRRSAGMRLLADASVPAGRHFELLPDWDEPDVATLPEERNAAYLLNLRGVASPLPAQFFQDLVHYAGKLNAADSYLVVAASSDVWAGRLPEAATGIRVVDIERPVPRKVVEQYLPADRVIWLDDPGSSFFGVLPAESAPSEAVRLADVIVRAKGPVDVERLDEYLGWTDTVRSWFRGGSRDVESRAIRIAGAVLNEAPAAVILDSADVLLRAPEIDLPQEVGGLLARPDASKRLEPAGMSFDPVTGTAHLVHASQGPALLTYLWTQHIQLSEVLTRWLQEISSGPARGNLDVLAGALTTLAQAVGISPVLKLVDGWLALNDVGSIDLVGDLLSDLAVHPTLGGKIRPELAKWAGGKSQPARQQAIARAVANEFGRTYTSQALNRVRSLLRSPGSEDVRQRALKALRRLIATPELTALTVDTLVKWISAETETATVEPGVFLNAFSPFPNGKPVPEPLLQALSQGEEAGQAIRRRLIEGWVQVADREHRTGSVQDALLEWRRAAETNLVPEESFVDFMVSLGRHMGHVDPLFLNVVKAEGRLKDKLITRIFADVAIAYDRAPEGSISVATVITGAADIANDQS